MSNIQLFNFLFFIFVFAGYIPLSTTTKPLLMGLFLFLHIPFTSKTRHLLNKTRHLLNKTRRLLNETRHLFVKTRPLLEKRRRLLNETRRVLDWLRFLM